MPDPENLLPGEQNNAAKSKEADLPAVTLDQLKAYIAACIENTKNFTQMDEAYRQERLVALEAVANSLNTHQGDATGSEAVEEMLRNHPNIGADASSDRLTEEERIIQTLKDMAENPGAAVSHMAHEQLVLEQHRVSSDHQPSPEQRIAEARQAVAAADKTGDDVDQAPLIELSRPEQ